MNAGPTIADLTGLIGAMAAGDRTAFEKLYLATSRKLFGVILRILRDREAAEDVLQEAYVRIWENAGRFDPERASPITWMSTIARNRAIDVARRRRPRPAEDVTAAERVVDPSPSALSLLGAAEDARRLDACLESLDPPHGQMVRLAYLDGLSRQELADRFDQPVGTIKTWLRRSLARLRDCMDR